jgi:hypothetical protein
MTVPLLTRSSKVQRPSPGPCARPRTRLVGFGSSAGVPGRDRGCARESGWSSHNWGRRLCEIISKFGSPDWAKRREIFVSPLLPHPPSSALSSPPSRLSSVRVKVSYLDNHPQVKSIFLLRGFHRAISFSVDCLSCTTSSSLPSTRFRVHLPSKSPLLAQRTSWSLLVVSRVSITSRPQPMPSTLPSKRSCPPFWTLN